MPDASSSIDPTIQSQSPQSDGRTAAGRIQVLFDRAQRYLSHRRVLHLYGVTHTAATLAVLHGLSVEDAILAGLLHDQSKELPPKQLLDEMLQMGQRLHGEDREFPHIWHGFHAAAWAKTHLGVVNHEVLEAVRLHTTADAGLGAIGKTLYIADLCEPNRPTEIAPAILKAARLDLDDGFRQALRYKSLHVLLKKKAPLHPRGVRAIQFFLGVTPERLREMRNAECGVRIEK